MIGETELEALRPLLAAIAETDVLAMGGGSAGFTAADAAAGTGVKAVFVPRSSFLSGATTEQKVDFPSGTDLTQWWVESGTDVARLTFNKTSGRLSQLPCWRIQHDVTRTSERHFRYPYHNHGAWREK